MAVEPLVAVVSGAVGGVLVVVVAVLVTVRLCHGRLGRRDTGRQAAADMDVPSASPSPPTGKGIDSTTLTYSRNFYLCFVCAAAEMFPQKHEKA